MPIRIVIEVGINGVALSRIGTDAFCPVCQLIVGKACPVLTMMEAQVAEWPNGRNILGRCKRTTNGDYESAIGAVKQLKPLKVGVPMRGELIEKRAKLLAQSRSRSHQSADSLLRVFELLHMRNITTGFDREKKTWMG